jgi:hypothetical protein
MKTSEGGGSVAEGEVLSVCECDDFRQHFLYAMKYTRAISSKIAIMAAGEENNQWCD